VAGSVGLGIPGLEDAEWIASGGNSSVYRARQTQLDRTVAVKVLTVSDEDARRRFDRERRAMGRLSRHPGILTIYESGFTADGRPFLLLPFVDGGSLQDLLDGRGPLPWEDAVDLAQDIAETLAFAHEHGVIHADLKPANVLLDPDGEPLVADFGIARLTDAAVSQTVAGFTPNFAAPEMLRGQKVSAAVDVYGLGALLFALVDGSPPYVTRDGDIVALIDQIASSKVPRLKQGMPASLQTVIDDAMAKAPEDRPTAAELAVRLSVLPKSDGRSGRRLWLKALTAGVAAAVLAVAGALVWDRLDPEVSSSSASTQPEGEPTTLVPTTAAGVTASTAVTFSSSPAEADPPLYSISARTAIPLGGVLGTPIEHDGLIWVLRTEDDGSGSLVQVEQSGAIRDAVEVGSHPRGPVVSGTGVVWVHDAGDGTLTAVGSGPGVIERVDLGQPGHDGESLEGFEFDFPAAGEDGSVFVAMSDPQSIASYKPGSADGVQRMVAGRVARPVAEGPIVWSSYSLPCAIVRERTVTPCFAIRAYDATVGAWGAIQPFRHPDYAGALPVPLTADHNITPYPFPDLLEEMAFPDPGVIYPSGDDLWLSLEHGQVWRIPKSFASDSTVRAQVYSCDGLVVYGTPRLLLAQTVAWIAYPGSGLCALDLTSAEPTVIGQLELDTDDGASLTPTGMDDSVWLASSSGLRLVSLAEGGGLEVLSTLDIERGIGKPFLDSKGVLWVPGVGYLYRLPPGRPLRP
jgi:serine/threonine protein kinase